MSSSRRNAPRTSNARSKEKILTCPTCGKRAMARVRRTVRFDDGLVVPRLLHYQCRSCGEQLFDDDAMTRIEEASLSCPVQ